MEIHIASSDAMKAFGARLGGILGGGEVIELIGDVGAGKTTLAKGIALGLGVDEDVQSPSFTISRLYTARDDLRLAHYDFYRLHDAGVMAMELAENAHERQTVTVIEWADIVQDALPDDRLSLSLSSISENERLIKLEAHGEKSQQVLEAIT